jgi:hypothetical protein
MHQLFATYLMPSTLSWESLLLLIRRKFHTLLRYGVIIEFAIAYEDLELYFEVDEQNHNIPVCHCWCCINTIRFESYVVHDKLKSLGLIMIEEDCEISDDYIEGMRNLILHREDCVNYNKYMRWKVSNLDGNTHLIRIDFGTEAPEMQNSELTSKI